jgi:predicted oxidoreductase
LGDKLIRTAKPHKLLDPDAGPLIAVRLNILTRKTLGGLQTDLDSRVLAADGQPVPGLYAAGEVAGLGGGVHGSRRHIPGGVSSRVAQPNRPPQKRSGDGNG